MKTQTLYQLMGLELGLATWISLRRISSLYLLMKNHIGTSQLSVSLGWERKLFDEPQHLAEAEELNDPARKSTVIVFNDAYSRKQELSGNHSPQSEGYDQPTSEAVSSALKIWKGPSEKQFGKAKTCKRPCILIFDSLTTWLLRGFLPSAANYHFAVSMTSSARHQHTTPVGDDELSSSSAAKGLRYFLTCEQYMQVRTLYCDEINLTTSLQLKQTCLCCLSDVLAPQYPWQSSEMSMNMLPPSHSNDFMLDPPGHNKENEDDVEVMSTDSSSSSSDSD